MICSEQSQSTEKLRRASAAISKLDHIARNVGWAKARSSCAVPTRKGPAWARFALPTLDDWFHGIDPPVSTQLSLRDRMKGAKFIPM